MTEQLTGRRGFIMTIPEGKEETMLKRSSIAFAEYMTKIAMDGRDFIVRTRRTRAEGGIPGEMYISKHPRYKVTVRVALTDYEKTKIGECTLLPNGRNNMVFYTRSDTYIGDDGKDVDCTVEVVRIGDIWLEQSFSIDYDKMTYRRIDEPDINILKPVNNCHLT